MTVTAAILHEQRLPKGQAVGATGAIRAVQCFPVHHILDQQTIDWVYEDTTYGLQYGSLSRQLRDTTCRLKSAKSYVRHVASLASAMYAYG
jgi:hypothetical protein